jgi:hypothetical protein
MVEVTEMRGIATTFLATGIALSATAQVRITEALLNPTGFPDAGHEFIEIQSCRPNFSLQGYWLIGIDGENLFNPGNIHWAIDLSAYSTGSNGLLLVRDSDTVLQPAPAPETTVVVIPNAFTPTSMGNDSYTVALVRNFTGQPGDDIDTNNDGIIDNVLWSEAVQAFGWEDDEETDTEPDHIYPTQLNGVDIPASLRRRTDGSTWEPDVIIFFQNNSIVVADVVNADGDRSRRDPGPFLTSQANFAIIGTPPAQFNRQVTPGNLNPGDRPAVEGDVNCDRCVDDADLLQVLFNFGDDNPNSDINGDGVVDDADLLTVLFNFGSGC